MIDTEWEDGEKLYIPTCDGCGAQLPEEYDFYDAVDAKKVAGWKSIRHGKEWSDLCPECAEKTHSTAVDDFGGVVNG